MLGQRCKVHGGWPVRLTKIAIIMKPIYAYPLLILGAAIVLYIPVTIDVNMRIAYWESRADYPNMDPRIMYSIALYILAAIAIVASVIEVFRVCVFKLNHLQWWQAMVVGGSYAVYFSGLALRHAFEPDTARTIAVLATVLINPVTTYFILRGFRKSAA